MYVGNLGKLEALRVANQGTIKELKIEVASLKEKVRWLETEREEIKNSSVSAHEQQARSIQSLEKVVDLFIMTNLVVALFIRSWRNFQRKNNNYIHNMHWRLRLLMHSVASRKQH